MFLKVKVYRCFKVFCTTRTEYKLNREIGTIPKKSKDGGIHQRLPTTPFQSSENTDRSQLYFNFVTLKPQVRPLQGISLYSTSPKSDVLRVSGQEDNGGVLYCQVFVKTMQGLLVIFLVSGKLPDPEHVEPRAG